MRTVQILTMVTEPVCVRKASLGCLIGLGGYAPRLDPPDLWLRPKGAQHDNRHLDEIMASV